MIQKRSLWIKRRLKKLQSRIEENLEEKDPETKIAELEEKIVRQYAEMENQRRRYEKKEMMLLSMVVSLLLKKH